MDVFIGFCIGAAVAMVANYLGYTPEYVLKKIKKKLNK